MYYYQSPLLALRTRKEADADLELRRLGRPGGERGGRWGYAEPWRFVKRRRRGLPPDDLEKVFDHFGTFESTMRRWVDGTLGT